MMSELSKFKDKHNYESITLSKCGAANNNFEIFWKLNDEEIIKIISIKEPQKITDQKDNASSQSYF